jgi:hypothetical protein
MSEYIRLSRPNKQIPSATVYENLKLARNPSLTKVDERFRAVSAGNHQAAFIHGSGF